MTLETAKFMPAFDARLCGAPGAAAADLSKPFRPTKPEVSVEAPVGSLRVRLRQPSTMWSGSMELRNLRCFTFDDPEPSEGDPASPLASPPLGDGGR